MPVNPPKKVTTADRAKAIEKSSRDFTAVLMALIAGYAAASDLGLLAVGLAAAAVGIISSR